MDKKISDIQARISRDSASRIKMLIEPTNKAYEQDWRKVPIEENNEPLVRVPSLFCDPYYHNVLKIAPDKRIYVRKTVNTMLAVARNYLYAKARLELILLDGYRLLEVQNKLFWKIMHQFTIDRKEFAPYNLRAFFTSDAWENIHDTFYSLEDLFRKEGQGTSLQRDLFAENRKFVAWPSDDPTMPSPHATAGAVDVWIYDKDGPVDMGRPFDHMDETVGAFYHLKEDRQRFDNDEMVCFYRSLLLDAMTAAGFSIYPDEFWHFNYGNQMDGLIQGKPAIYSYIKPPED